ncbi:1220_t:CDS:2 [Acaulospora colombiana]|uniref:1220_t:CDS:1 n=1 Tax=Acaulospora colombiana TaxID=27376 RepID=A0ACA9M6X0_9GLOM|nr:1220_t:CDS:2 [Acaulospora colombiana]
MNFEIYQPNLPSTIVFNNEDSIPYNVDGVRNHNLYLLNNRGTGESTDSLLDETLKLGVALECRHNFIHSGDYSEELLSNQGFFRQKYHRPSSAKQLHHSVVYQRLDINESLDKDQASGWAYEIAQEVKQRLADRDPKKYRYLVNVTIMENKLTENMINSSQNKRNQILLRVEMFQYLTG